MNWPKISIAIQYFTTVNTLKYPSFLLLSQNYHNFEYIIIDGGSTLDNVEIIKNIRTSDYLACPAWIKSFQQV